jgi:hypothetical protein
MAKVSQRYADLEEANREFEGPDQEPPTDTMSVALPVLAEVVAVLLMFACAFVWCIVGSGRLPELPV